MIPARRRTVALLVAAALWCAAADVCADDGDDARAFHYVSLTPPDRPRALLELEAILALGYVNYRLSEGQNSADFDLSYRWTSLRDKVTGKNVSFDTNSLPTNYASHAFSGSLYYLAARGNRLSVGESFLFSLGASTMWEYADEYREKASINDLVYTPLAGLAVGETFNQLGIFFERSRPNALNLVIADFFAAPKRLNDVLDGAEPTRSDHVDALGLAADEWHHFDFFTDFGATWQHAASGGNARVVTPSLESPDLRYGIDSEVMKLPHREFRGWLTDGNLTHLHFENTISGLDIVDFLFAARASTVAYVARRGEHRFVAAQTIGLDYGYHDYDRDGAQGIDRLATTDLGVNLEYASSSSRDISGRVRLLAAGDFAGTGSYARDTYLARGGRVNALPTILTEQGYYFAIGPTVTATGELGVDRFELGSELRVDQFWGISGADRFQSRIVDEASLADTRLAARGWLRVRVVDHVGFGVSFTERFRDGHVNDVRRSRLETTGLLGANVEL